MWENNVFRFNQFIMVALGMQNFKFTWLYNDPNIMWKSIIYHPRIGTDVLYEYTLVLK